MKLRFSASIKKNAVHRGLLVEEYIESALSKTMSSDWFWRCNDGNFNLSDMLREHPTKKNGDFNLETNVKEDDTQLHERLLDQLSALHKEIFLRWCAREAVQKV